MQEGKTVKIAIFGSYINTNNLGCLALSYSLISMLERIAKDSGYKFSYELFEYEPNIKLNRDFKKRLNIEEHRLNSYNMMHLISLRRYLFAPISSVQMISKLRKCAAAVDLTAGDSFSDIYGIDRFVSFARLKSLVELLGIPLILGPQTYGPFYDKKNEKRAGKILKRAFSVIARDKESSECVFDISGRNIEITTDLAFQLPFDRADTKECDTLRVGISISALLDGEHNESGIEDTLDFKTDYDQYIFNLLEYLNKKKYEVHLISHVGKDHALCEKYHKSFPDTIVVPFYDNPIDIKSYISGMDVFIGSRMHATIAAFTCGIATIPVAYSRKFKSLFELVGYNRTLDMAALDTNELLNKTILYIDDFKTLKKEVNDSLKLCDMYESKTYEFFKSSIEKACKMRI